MQGTRTSTGIGPALREARLLRGTSVEEASRQTRIRPEYLRALEGERFEALIGDVYVRGFLRSYSGYLGLDADEVVELYNRRFGPPRSGLPEPASTRDRNGRSRSPALPSALRRHPSWAFAVSMALLAMVAFGFAGLLSGSRGAPDTRPAPLAQPSITVLPPSVVVTLTAREEVRAVVEIDGERVGKAELPGGVIREGQGLSFEGGSVVEVWLERGGVVEVAVNGRALGAPGSERAPYTGRFRPTDGRSQGFEPSPPA